MESSIWKENPKLSYVKAEVSISRTEAEQSPALPVLTCSELTMKTQKMCQICSKVIIKAQE